MKYDLSNEYKKQCFFEFANKLATDKKMVELKECKLKDIQRTNDQNALYWVWLTCIQHENGMDKNHAHFLYRAMYLQKSDEHIEKLIRTEIWKEVKKYIQNFTYFEWLGEIIDFISFHTPDNGTSEFAEYLKKIKIHARANMGIILVNLDEKTFVDFYREYGFI